MIVNKSKAQHQLFVGDNRIKDICNLNEGGPSAGGTFSGCRRRLLEICAESDTWLLVVSQDCFNLSVYL